MRPLYRKQCNICVCVCVGVHARAAVTDVSQSASPHAEACPSLGSQPRQEVSVLTLCVLASVVSRRSSSKRALRTDATAEECKGLTLQ